MARSGKRRAAAQWGCKSLSIRHQLLHCSVALARCRGLARFVMTASLLRCLCQQFEMALVLRACDRFPALTPANEKCIGWGLLDGHNHCTTSVFLQQFISSGTGNYFKTTSVGSCLQEAGVTHVVPAWCFYKDFNSFHPSVCCPVVVK